MGFLFILIIGIVWFYFKIYGKWGYYGKFICKAIILSYVLLHTVLFMIGTVSLIPKVYEEQKENAVSRRLEKVKQTMNKGNYCDVAAEMYLYDNYEPEFEFVWERLQMYACYEQYLVFKEAAVREPDNQDYANGLERYETILYDVCQKPEYKENIVYGEYYLQEAGFSKE